MEIKAEEHEDDHLIDQETQSLAPSYPTKSEREFASNNDSVASDRIRRRKRTATELKYLACPSDPGSAITMRSSTAFNLAVLASILLPEPSLATIKLSQFQAISGFSDDCTAAYDSPVKECDSSDFKDGNSCSSDCVTALTTLQTTINSACQGSRAEPGTLIALFFEDEGVSTLCPNIVLKPLRLRLKPVLQLQSLWLPAPAAVE